MKNWLVKEIQIDILNNQSITNILRKSLILARKLNLIDFEKFINSELNWYTSEDKIPQYRVIGGYRILWWNPYHWWTLVNIDNEELFNKLVIRDFWEAISKVEVYSGNWCEIILPTELMSQFMNVSTQYKVSVAYTEFLKIVEGVKNIILDKCIELEKNWILWEWISFSEEEIKKAENINHTTNIFHGTISGAQFQISTNNSIQQNTIHNINYDKLKNFLYQVDQLWDKIKELPQNELITTDLNYIKNEIEAEHPSQENIISRLLSVKNILSWAGWNLIASWILAIIHTLFN